MILKVDFIKRRLAGHPVRARFNLELEPGSIAFLAGPQGSGKSTVLQAIRGNLRPDAGRLIFGNQIWFYGDGQKRLEIQDRPVGLLAGEADLLPDKSVRWNVSLALAHWPTRSRGLRITEVLSRVGLEKKSRALASSLTSEERLRLALARSIAPRPGLLLLDDPFNGFLPLQQQRLVQELRAILREEGIPAILGLLEAQDIADPSERILGVDALPVRRSAFSRPSAVA